MKALQFNVNAPQFVAAKTLGLIFGKQVFYRGSVKTIQLADIPEPALPSPDWVKIKTIYSGFCGSDLDLILLLDVQVFSPKITRLVGTSAMMMLRACQVSG